MWGALAGRTARLGGAAALLACAAAMAAAPPGAVASTASAEDRYSLVHGCFGLRSVADGGYVAKAGDGYDTAAGSLSGAEPFRMQATDLGKYLLYGAAEDFLAVDATPVVGGIASADAPSDDSDWTVDEAGSAFTLVNEAHASQLAVDEAGALVAVPGGSAGQAGHFAFEERTGCATYPEVDVNVSGDPVTGKQPYGEVSGLLEGHMHHMAFEFLGGDAHCGRPWHRFGAPFALRDCTDHEPNGCGAVLENVLYGEPARCHDTTGWPEFTDWPDPNSLTHEQSYYRWLERSWRSGQRIFVNLLVENRVLCEAYPIKHNSCDEMDSVLLQAQRMQELQDYIDAQSGGPGEGWFRIVRNPFRARKVINQGKLAVVMGMEVSEPFGCRLQPPNQTPACEAEDITGWLDQLHELGVRQLEIINKFDNALSGVAGDDGDVGAVVNSANFASTGSFWELDDNCPDAENHDHAPTTPAHNDDLIIANGIEELLPGQQLPVYPDPPLCNQLGLSGLGEHAIGEIMERRMVFDPDHMSVVGRDEALDIVEAEEYPGLISSHSWSTPNTLPRIYRLGGVITPYAGSSESFVHQWSHLREVKDELGRQYYGVGYGADMNGFGSQGEPRGPGIPNPVTYPFPSWDGKVTVEQQVSGVRAFDINTDGVAHYGLYPDWVQDLRKIAGDQITEDMGRGAEAYLQMWERTQGIAEVRCDGWGTRNFTRQALGDRIRLHARPKPTLQRAGQPEDRTRTWTWCANPTDESRKVKAVFDPRGNVGLIASTLPQHGIAGAAPGENLSALPRAAEQLGGGVYTADAGNGRRHVWVAEGGRITATGLAQPAISIGDYVELADLP